MATARLIRGLGRPCLKLPGSCVQASASRLFTTRLCLRAAATQRSRDAATQRSSTPNKQSATATSLTPPSSSSPTYYALLKNYGNKTTSTTLYEAPSHFWYYFGCLSSGTFILNWTMLTSRALVMQPEGVPQWVSGVYGVSYMILASMGIFLIMRTRNIVQSIEMLPRASPFAGRKSTTTQGSHKSPLQMRLTVRRMLPMLMKPKAVVVSLDKVQLKSRFSLPGEHVQDLRRRQMEREAAAKQEALRRFDMAHLLTMPFRRMGRLCVSFFRGVRSAWSNSDFGYLIADGQTYKVDITQGFALDGFRELECLVSVQSNKT